MSIRRIGLYGLSSLLPLVVFLPGLTTFFLADDWPILASNANVTWLNWPQLFAPQSGSFYRPVFYSFIALLWKLFGLSPVGYHIVILLLFGVLSGIIGNLAEFLTADRRIGILSSILFAANSVHVEPVLWIASSNEILAGLFVLLTLTAYIAFRRTGNHIWLPVAMLLFLMSLGTKETAVFLPIMLLAHDIFLYHPNGKRKTARILAASGPFILVGAAFVVFRLAVGSPYSVSAEVSRLGLNLVFYFLVELLALPDNYGYFSSLPLWRQEPLLPVLSLGFSGTSLTIMASLLLRSKMRPVRRCHPKVLWFAIGWSVIALSPVVLVATVRTAFMSSIGVAWSLAILSIAMWDDSPARLRDKRWILLALGMLMSAYLLVSMNRTYWWVKAGQTVESVLNQLETHLKSVDSRQEALVIGLPDHFRNAYAFRNAFPGAGSLLFPSHRNLRAVLDSEVEGLTIEQSVAYVPDVGNEAIVFWYDSGILQRIR